MPTKKHLDIINYWAESEDYANGDDSGMGIDHSDIGENGGRCWRCATTKNIQRCHIVGKSQGGSDEPSNLILLCKDCHDDAPMTKNATAESFFNWIKKSRELIIKPFSESRFSFAYNLCLGCYPPANKRGNYWTLKVYKLALEVYDCDVLERRIDLIESFTSLIKDKFPIAEVDNSEHIEVCRGICEDWLDDLAFDGMGEHFPQKSGLTQAKYQSEACTRVESIKHIESHLESGCEETIKAIKSFFSKKYLKKINKKLGFPLFILDNIKQVA